MISLSNNKDLQPPSLISSVSDVTTILSCLAITVIQHSRGISIPFQCSGLSRMPLLSGRVHHCSGRVHHRFLELVITPAELFYLVLVPLPSLLKFLKQVVVGLNQRPTTQICQSDHAKGNSATLLLEVKWCASTADWHEG